MIEVPKAASSRSRLTALAWGLAATFSLFATSLVVPLLGFFSGVIAPFPVINARLFYDRFTALAIFAGGAAAITALFGVQAGALYLLQCGTSALVLPELVLKGYGAARCIYWTVAVNLSFLLAAAIVFAVAGGNDLHLTAKHEIETSIAQAVALYEKSGVGGDELATLKRTMNMAAAMLVRIYPALATIVLALVTAANVWLVRRISSIKAGVPLAAGEFQEFRVKEHLIWLLILAGFALVADNPLLTTPALNIVIVMCALYFIQGLSVILTIIARQTFSGFIRIFFWMMLVFQPYLAAVVATIGIFDLWADFRTPRKQENL